jgi:hypothetical protein
MEATDKPRKTAWIALALAAPALGRRLVGGR